MSEPLPPPPVPETTHPAVEPDAALARKNMLWGWALLGIWALLFAGVVGVAFVYLALD